MYDGRIKIGENIRDDFVRRRVNRGWTRYRGKNRVNESVFEFE